jgi:FSR family fosmidomycin resistance protein-like MFS transporter
LIPRTPTVLGSVVLLAVAHLVVDGYANIYAPLLPLLIPRLNLSLADAGVLAMLFQLAASVSQLGFGWLADRWRPKVLLVAGPFAAVALLSLVGLAGSAVVLGALLVGGGLGCAAFHPPAAVAAHQLGSARPGLAMSVYITGGTLGFAFGPLFFAPFAERFGLSWTPALAVPGLVILALVFRRAPRIEMEPAAERPDLRALRPYAKPLALLYIIVVLRTLTGLGLATFVPVLLTERGMSVATAGSVFALYLLTSSAGGFLGGVNADRFGPRRVMILSLLVAAPLLAVAPLLDGAWFVAVLSAGGFFLLSTQPVCVTFGQMLAPVSAGIVASLMMGVAWGTGGLAVPIVGLVADHIGIEAALTWLAAVPVVAAFCAWPLPSTGGATAARWRGPGSEPLPGDVVR